MRTRVSIIDLPTPRQMLCWAVPAALMVAGCAASGAAETPTAPVEEQAPEVHPESGLALTALTVITQQGAARDFVVEIAASPQEQQQGLMFRRSMGADKGMIFPFAQVRMASFWMRNTVIPLDIIFIGPDGRIVNIAENATPYSDDRLRSIAPVAAVLELNGGRSAELGIAAGDLVEW